MTCTECSPAVGTRSRHHEHNVAMRDRLEPSANIPTWIRFGSAARQSTCPRGTAQTNSPTLLELHHSS